MEWFVRNFIKASLVWLGLAVSLGVAMAAHPAWVVYTMWHRICPAGSQTREVQGERF